MDDLGGNALLWQMAALAYQLLHMLRTTTLQGRWRGAQPHPLRIWLFRVPAMLTRHARMQYVQIARGPDGSRIGPQNPSLGPDRCSMASLSRYVQDPG